MRIPVMKYLGVLIGLIGSINSKAQSLEIVKQTVASGGNTVSLGRNISINYTIGQLGTISSALLSNAYLSNGFQNLINNSSSYLEKTIDIKIFPNPTTSKITIQWSDKFFNESDAISLRLFDSNGKLVHQSNPVIEGNQLGDNLHAVADGLYLLKVEGSGGAIIQQPLLIRK